MREYSKEKVKIMGEKNQLQDLFEELLSDETEREIMKLILQNKSREDIVKALLNGEDG